MEVPDFRRHTLKILHLVDVDALVIFIVVYLVHGVRAGYGIAGNELKPKGKFSNWCQLVDGDLPLNIRFPNSEGQVKACVSVVTKIGKDKEGLLDRLKREKIPVFLRESPRTTTFINIYPAGLDNRQQRVIDGALPFTTEDVEGIKTRVFHLGPIDQR